MRYGIHLSSLCKTWDEDLEPHIKTAKELGYDGVEFPLLDPESFDVGKYRKLVEDLDIVPLFATGISSETDISSADAKVRDRGMKHLKACIDVVAEFKAPYLSGVIHSPWGLVMRKDEADGRIGRIIDSLRAIADYAERHGIAINLEVLNRFESYVFNTIEEGVGFLKRVNRKNVRLHFDTFHAHIEEKSVLHALKRGGQHIGHVHFSENDRGIPLTGQVHWDEVYEGLTAIGYDGWICLESFVNANCEVGEGTNIWRQIEPSDFVTAKEGLINMKRIMKER